MATANILLVDDEIPFVETMNRRLTKRGINILTAFNGQEALEYLVAGKKSMSSSWMSRCPEWTDWRP